MNFDAAFEKLLGHEGGYVNNPADPGGETKFGISKRSYPAEDIAGLTIDRAKAIYLRDYWGPAGCDALPDAIRFDVFDTAVNSGVRTAVKLLQRAVGETEDGVIGPRTLQAVGSMAGPRLAARFNGARLSYMTDVPAWATFGRGWARRIAANLQGA
jgi:lysozyme family protein